MSEMSELRTSYAGKEVLRAAREARNLVRDGGAEDEHGVVDAGREQTIEVDLDGFGDEPARQLADTLSAQLPEFNQLLRTVPLVVEDASQKRERRSFA